MYVLEHCYLDLDNIYIKNYYLRNNKKKSEDNLLTISMKNLQKRIFKDVNY